MRIYRFFCCFISLALFFCADICADLQEGLVIYFSFDKIDGDAVINEAGLEINGVLEAEAKQVPGFKDMGLALNAEVGEATPGNDFVRVADQPEVNVDKQFTIAVWANASNFGSYRTLLSKTDAGAYALTVENSVPTAWVHVQGDYLYVLGKTELQTGEWYHLALTFDGKDAVIYLNGEEEARGTKQGDVTICNADFMIGAEPSGQAVDPSYPAWHGVLDEFYFYNRALTEDEINMLIEEASAVEPVDKVPAAGKLASSWGSVKSQ